MKETPSYIKTLTVPVSSKTRSRRVWGIELENVWLPFFTATNAMGDTAIPVDALGCPLRLQYDKDGAVKFSPNGRPVIRVAKPISEAVSMVRDNFIANLMSYSEMVATENDKAYARVVNTAQKAGKPIAEHDTAELNKAITARLEAELEAETETPDQTSPDQKPEGKPETEKVPVTA